MTKTTSTRSAYFAATSQLMLLLKVELSWYSATDKAKYKRDTLQRAKQLRLRTVLLALSSDSPTDLSKDALTNRSGIEALAHFSLKHFKVATRDEACLH